MRWCLPVIVALAGCAQPQNLQPLIAVAGTYSIMEHDRRPSPAPTPAVDGCTKGCKCNGTGIEPTGDGLSKSPCRCPDDCPCKKKSAAVVTGTTICTTGSCAGWPPRNMSR